MTHGMYHYIKQAWKKPDSKVIMNRMTELRKEPAQINVYKPLRLDRARAL
jgi:ribosomal protein L15E